ncbi:MAG: macro domain-containing protein [Lachnospiraceae bacterium]|nr:macro domain-containing protein [Lachnospiraceae bacterium]
MPLKIVRNDITKMEVDAVVNTANADVAVGRGCDAAIYDAAGFDELFEFRKEVGPKKEGEAFISPGFKLPAGHIIHAVSPLFIDGNSGEEEKLRKCYRNSLRLAEAENLKSVAFPLISTGSFGYPKAEGMRIAADEINAFLLTHDMLVYIVVFDSESADYGRKLYPDLESYIDNNYVGTAGNAEYGYGYPEPVAMGSAVAGATNGAAKGRKNLSVVRKEACRPSAPFFEKRKQASEICEYDELYEASGAPDFDELHYGHTDKIKERLAHLSDDYVDYLMYLINEKGLKPSDVYKDALIDKKLFSKIKNKKDPHPEKLTLMQLCIGAKLNLDESTDLLARAGYAFSPCTITDIIFKYFIENGYYDMVDLDIELENHDVPCIIKI